MPSVLIIDDEPNIRRMVGALLQAEGYDVREAASGVTGVQAISDDEPDVALLDLMMPGELNGIATLSRIRERWSYLPVIMMSGRASLSDAVQATKLGAVNFLEKPLSPETVLLALNTALELRQTRRAARALREEFGLTGEMVGSSIAMMRVREIIDRVALTDSRVLISGESGTGKELVAAAIHDKGARRDKPFVRVNCAAIPRDLVESEMFGHEKGSFTGATATRVGRFELAHTGTLFLDEIGDLTIEAQAKLLRAIEAKEIQRVGGNKTIRVDVRIIAATNKDLSRAVADGTFREDLYFRLNVIPIDLPPLRERDGDAVELIRHFSAVQHQRTGRPLLRWSDDALARMQSYVWPGNVRELANIVERIAILNTGSQVNAADVLAVLPQTVVGARTELSTNTAASFHTLASQGLTDALDEMERTLITDALAKANGSVAEAARQLQTDRPNLYRRMKRLGIIATMLLLAFVIPLRVRVSGISAQLLNAQTQPASAPPIRAPNTQSASDTTVTTPASHDTLPSSPHDSSRDDDTVSTVKVLPRQHLGVSVTSGKTYNRVEGLPVHLGPTYSLTDAPVNIHANAYGILRTVGQLKFTSANTGYDAGLRADFGPSHMFGAGVQLYDVVAPIEPWQLTEPEAGLAAFLLHRDYFDYYTRHGARATLNWIINRKASVVAGYANERWGSVSARDPFTVLRNDDGWRPNPFVDQGLFHLFTLDAKLDTRNDDRTPSVGWYLRGTYEYGHSANDLRPESLLNVPGMIPQAISYGRVFFDLRRYNRLSPRTQVNGRLVYGGWIQGDELPMERKLSVGGLGTIPGYDFRRVAGDDDIQLCHAGTTVPLGAPAQCDRVVLGQLEFREQLSSSPFSISNAPIFRLRSAGFTVSPVGVLFADIGHGWRTTEPWPSGNKADIGTGLDLGLLGLYVAKSITDWNQAANFFIRVQRRF